MRRFFKLFLIVLVLLGCIFYFNVKADDTIKTPKKGDLRCPSNSNINCTPHYDKDGNIIQVDITYKVVEEEGEIELVKSVKKTTKLGEYEVSFNVKGNGLKSTLMEKPVYIAVIYDVSGSISSKTKEAQSAIVSFANTLIPTSLNGKTNYYLGLLQFGTYIAKGSKGRREFQNTNFSGLNFYGYDKGLGRTSNLQTAFNEVKKWFDAKSVPADALKYVVLFGDGNYWVKTSSSSPGDVYKYANDLKKSGVTIIPIRYLENGLKSPVGCTTVNTNLCGTCANKNWKQNSSCKPTSNGKYGICNNDVCDNDTMNVLSSIGSYKSANKKEDFTKYFLEVANEIQKEAMENASFKEGILTDDIGGDFELVEGPLRYKQYIVERLNETGTSYGPFNIQIIPEAKEGWHKTNEDFTFSYKDASGNDKTIAIKDNPEVYWIPDSEEIPACTGFGKKNYTYREELEYYSKVCEEGYNDSLGNYKEGYQVFIKTNNLAEGVKNFNIKSGIGFPTTIDINANLKCTYVFKNNVFNKDYNDILNSLKNAKTPEEIASLTVKKNRLDEIKENYQNITADLYTYKTNFTNQSASMEILYNDGSRSSTTFINDTLNVGDPKCTDTTLDGNSVKTCIVEFSKSMKLPNTCLDMKTGNQASCTSDNNQLNGGNNYYVDTNKASGKIIINIKNSGYRENYNFKLDDTKDGDPACSFTNTNNKIIFRQIDIQDPFLKTTDPSRLIGKNYQNSKFDFINIIQGNIWDLIPEYEYSMSKVNVSNIRKDTSLENDSYLGQNCYFVNNEYQCRFTRNLVDDNENNSKNWFSNVDGSKLK